MKHVLTAAIITVLGVATAADEAFAYEASASGAVQIDESIKQVEEYLGSGLGDVLDELAAYDPGFVSKNGLSVDVARLPSLPAGPSAPFLGTALGCTHAASVDNMCIEESENLCRTFANGPGPGTFFAGAVFGCLRKGYQWYWNNRAYDPRVGVKSGKCFCARHVSADLAMRTRKAACLSIQSRISDSQCRRSSAPSFNDVTGVCNTGMSARNGRTARGCQRSRQTALNGLPNIPNIPIIDYRTANDPVKFDTRTKAVNGRY